MLKYLVLRYSERLPCHHPAVFFLQAAHLRPMHRIAATYVHVHLPAPYPILYTFPVSVLLSVRFHIVPLATLSIYVDPE